MALVTTAASNATTTSLVWAGFLLVEPNESEQQFTLPPKSQENFELPIPAKPVKQGFVLLPKVSRSPSGLHVTLNESDDLTFMAANTIAANSHIPNARIVLRTEHFTDPCVITPAISDQLTNLANAHNVTITVFTNSGEYAYEFVPQDLLDQQRLEAPLIASADNPTIHVTSVDLKKIIAPLRVLFDNWTAFLQILNSFWAKTANFQAPPSFTNSAELFSSPAYNEWGTISFDANSLLQIIIQTKEKYAATQMPEQGTIDQLSLFQYIVSDRLNKVTPLVFALAFKNLLPDSFMATPVTHSRHGSGVDFRKFGGAVKAAAPKDPYIGILEKVPPSTKMLKGLRIDFDPVLLSLPFEIEMLGKYADYARDPQQTLANWIKQISASRNQFTYSLSYIALAYVLFRDLMEEGLKVKNQSINIDHLNKGFEVLMGLFDEGVNIRINNELASRAGEQKEFESLSHAMKTYWEEVYNGLITHFLYGQPQ